MKILYIASNPPGRTTLTVEHEVTKLQKQLAGKHGNPIELRILPAVAFQDIRNEVQRFQPDILHISAHGTPDRVELADSYLRPMVLNKDNLNVILGRPHRPRLVYLNACHSAEIAEAFASIVDFSIGTDAAIENYYAREAAASFYDALAEGYSVDNAFEDSKALLVALSEGKVQSHLYKRDAAIGPECLRRVPTLVARFCGPENNGAFPFNVGVRDPLDEAMQVVVFTNDQTYIEDEDDLPDNLASITRDQCREQNAIWDTFRWTADGDVQLFACAVTLNGAHCTVSGMLSEALTNYYEFKHQYEEQREIPQRILKAIAKIAKTR